MGIMIGTLGRAATEMAAAILVHFHHVKGLAEWTPVSRREIADALFGDDEPDPKVLEWAANPFWRPDPMALVKDGFVEGWTEVDDPGRVTEKFLQAMERWRR